MKVTFPAWHFIAPLLLALTIQSCQKSDSAIQNNPPGNDTTKHDPQQKPWTAMAAVPSVGRQQAASFVIGQKFYVGLGSGFKDNNQQDLSDIYVFDLQTGGWSQKGDFPGGPREFAQGFSINGKGYIALGQSITCMPGCEGLNCCKAKLHNDIWEYNEATDQWTMVATIPDIDTNNVLVAKSFVIGSKAYIHCAGKFWEFDPSGYSITPKADCPGALVFTSSFAVNGKGYIGTGENGGSTLLKSVYEYDPANDHWTKKSDFAGPARRFATGFAVGGKGYIGCGELMTPLNANDFKWIDVNDVWEYSPDSDTWKQVANYPGASSLYKVAGVIGQKAIIGTGRTYEGPIFFLTEFWIY